MCLTAQQQSSRQNHTLCIYRRFLACSLCEYVKQFLAFLNERTLHQFEIHLCDNKGESREKQKEALPLADEHKAP